MYRWQFGDGAEIPPLPQIEKGKIEKGPTYPSRGGCAPHGLMLAELGGDEAGLLTQS
jgi:hypothetical protein